MTPKNIFASDEEKSLDDLFGGNGNSLYIVGRKVGYQEGLLKSQAEIAKLRELLVTAKFLVHCEYCYNGNCQPKLCMKRQWLRDYAALTKGEK